MSFNVNATVYFVEVRSHGNYEAGRKLAQATDTDPVIHYFPISIGTRSFRFTGKSPQSADLYSKGSLNLTPCR